MYKEFLEELVEAGHLRQYLDQPNARNQGNVHSIDEADDSGPDPPLAGHIRVIHGGKECAPVKEARADMRRQASEHHVMHLGQKRLREDGGKAVAISFSDEDLEGITTPHNDALVIMLNLNNFEIERILVDQGSSTDILYFKAFKKMGLTESDLKEVRFPLIGFSAEPV